MDVTIRDVEEADLPAVADLWRRTHPHLVMMTAAGIAHRLRTTPPHALGVYRVAVDADDRVVGTTRALLGTETAEPGQGFLSVVVDPAVRRRGIGARLLAGSVEHLLSVGAVVLHSRTGDAEQSVAFGRRHGFEVTRLELFQRCDLAVPLPDAPAPPDGVRLVPLDGLDPRAVWAADAEATLDIPGDVVADAMAFEGWTGSVWGNPELDRTLSTAAVDDSGTVLSLTLVEADPTALASGRAAVWSGMTGTVRAARGRGLATAVKTTALRAAARAGYTEAWTGNDESNAAMRAVNARLGYRPAVTGAGLVRRPAAR